jgi:CheY-like chemotaxis protein
VLEEFGYKVIEAVDGEDAIEKYRQNKDRIQLLLLDVLMPKKNGKEVYDEIRRENPDIRALFMSGYTASTIHKKGHLEKGLNFISKPVTPDDMSKKIREVLDK